MKLKFLRCEQLMTFWFVTDMIDGKHHGGKLKLGNILTPINSTTSDINNVFPNPTRRISGPVAAAEVTYPMNVDTNNTDTRA